MELSSCDSEDEVFVGEITERERRCPTFNSRRRTTVYFPGVSRPGSQVSFHHEHTDDGTLIFSFENMDVSGKEAGSAGKSAFGPMCSWSEMKDVEKESGGRSKKCHMRKETHHHVCLYEGSDVDSGTGSVSDTSDGSSVTSGSSPFLRCESDLKNKLSITRKSSSSDDKSGLSSSYQSPPLSPCKRQSVNHVPFSGAAETERTRGKGAWSTNARATTLTSKFQPELLALPSAPEMAENLNMYHRGSSFTAPTTSTYRKGMKRKIAQRPPTSEKSNAERTFGAHRTEKENRSSIMPYESDVGLGQSFDMFQMSRKLQKVDVDWEKLRKTEEVSEAQADIKLSTRRDNQAIHRKWVTSVDSDEEDDTNPSVEKVERDVSMTTTAVPLSQLIDMDTGHMIVKEGDYPEMGLGGKYQNMIGIISKSEQLSRTSKSEQPSTAGKGMQMTDGLTLLGDGDQFFSPCFPSEPSSSCVTASTLVPNSGNVSVSDSKLKPLTLNSSTESLIQALKLKEDQSLGSKYGNLVRRKPMTLKRRNKENVERNPLSGVQNTMHSYEQFEEDAMETMTRINTRINAETRHTPMDPYSSPALMTYFPPPKRASRVSWKESLAEEGVESQSSPTWPTVPPGRSILQQRADNHEFPFSRDPPSPIVLTRRRLARLP